MAEITKHKTSQLYKLRHSCAHALAQAVKEMFPEAKLGVGPPVDFGFYYDFDLPRTLIPEDLEIVEKKMRHIIKQNQKFVRRDEKIEEAVRFLEKAGQPYKVELVREFSKENDTVSFYENVLPDGTPKFVDLCEGNHVEHLGEIKAFKLLNIAGAYWRGNEKNPMLQRIYGACFETKEDLDAFLHQREEAKKRDHRKLGKELDLFTFSELVGSGLPLFTPRGTILRELLNDFSVKLRLEKGYQKVWIPHITKNDLYKRSGHWDKFGDELFLVKSQETDDELVMKPMNCPHHQQIYASQPRSYKDLPIKYLETTTIYRDEKAGELLGLSRVRAVTQDDSHTFCRPDQIEEVYEMLIDVTKTFYQKLGMPFKARLSFRDPAKPEKYLGEPELWEKAQNIILSVAQKNNLDHYVAEGEAAFYGPKIDFMVEDAIGRQWQLATPQLDFVQPKRFGLTYTDKDGQEKTPVMIHFALMGSIERFLAMYIEHTAGVFPFWLAPVQARIVPVSLAFIKYGEEIQNKLTEQGFRVELDDGTDTLGKKIRNAEMKKIPYMLVIGEKEVENQTVTLRWYATKKQETLSIAEVVKNFEELKL